jgi:hypothetical protein
MSPDSNIQSAFFDRIRKTIPANVSLVDELAEILDVSRDSAYRRMRGETVLSLDEVKSFLFISGFPLTRSLRRHPMASRYFSISRWTTENSISIRGSNLFMRISAS